MLDSGDGDGLGCWVHRGYGEAVVDVPPEDWEVLVGSRSKRGGGWWVLTLEAVFLGVGASPDDGVLGRLKELSEGGFGGGHGGWC